MNTPLSDAPSWRDRLPEGVRPYFESAPLAALFLGISSGFPFALLAATLTNRLSEAGIDKKSISAFALALLIYSFKWAWAPIVDRVRLPLLSGWLGQRRAWLWLAGSGVAAAVVVMGLANPATDLRAVVIGALLLGFAGATFDIVIDAYRIELLEPRQLGVGSGMSQYGWRLGAFFAATIALAVASVSNWTLGYIACVPLAFAGPIASLFGGESAKKKQRIWPTRMNRRSFFLFLLSFPIAFVIASAIDRWLDVTILATVVLLGYAYPVFDLTERRVQDFGWNGRFAFFLFIPAALFIIGGPVIQVAVVIATTLFLIGICVVPGQSGTNQYGEAPDMLARNNLVGPLVDFFRRKGAWLVFIFVLVHKIGDTIANLMIRDLLVTLGFTKAEILAGDVWVGFFALLAGIFVGGVLYTRLGMQRSVLISLILMAVSNLSFAGLAQIGHSMGALAFAIGFENFASGIGGVTVVAYLSALCNLRFTATQFALLSAAAAILGRFLTGTTAGALIEGLGYVDFYLLTTLLALPGVLLYWFMLRSGLIDRSIGSAGTETTDEQGV